MNKSFKLKTSMLAMEHIVKINPRTWVAEVAGMTLSGTAFGMAYIADCGNHCMYRVDTETNNTCSCKTCRNIICCNPPNAKTRHLLRCKHCVSHLNETKPFSVALHQQCSLYCKKNYFVRSTVPLTLSFMVSLFSSPSLSTTLTAM